MNEAVPSRDSDAVFRLMYRSRNLIPLDSRKAELGPLFSGARSSNKEKNITGALLIRGDWFAQVLEGDEEKVRMLFARIEQDPRHDRISVLQTGPGGERRFARWAMARVSADGQPDIPLIAHTDGIAPAAGRGTSAEQEKILDILRAATRDDAHAV